MSNTKKADATTATNGATQNGKGKTADAKKPTPKAKRTPEEIAKDIEAKKAELEKQNQLMRARSKFSETLEHLNDIAAEIENNEDDDDFENPIYRVSLSQHSQEVVRFNNPEVVKGFVDFLRPRVLVKIEQIDTQLLG